MAITRFASASAAISLSVVALFSACKKNEVAGPDCESQGGIVVEVNGEKVCEEKCDPSSCVAENACVANRCRLTCSAHTDCNQVLLGDANNQRCVVTQVDSDKGLNDGEMVGICEDTNIHPQAGLACPTGQECNGLFALPDGSPCDAEGGECKPLKCVSLGLEDAEAFCTTVDCSDDNDCLPGLKCGVIRIDNPPCGSPNKGDDSLPCIDPANNAAVGGTYQEGPLSLLQNACVKTEPCSPCVDQNDCAHRSDLTCVTIGEGSFCAETCFSNDDCPDDFDCFGAAAPTTGVCVPRSGTCKPPATNNFCYNCVNDLDCGPAGPGNTVGCLDLNGSQKGCFDFAFATSCTVDGDCPKSPSGRNGECLDEGENVPPSDPAYHKCYAPLVSSAGGFQCWLPN